MGCGSTPDHIRHIAEAVMLIGEGLYHHSSMPGEWSRGTFARSVEHLLELGGQAVLQLGDRALVDLAQVESIAAQRLLPYEVLTRGVKLLARLYDVDSGAVRIGGVDVREATFDSMRATVGMVTQDGHLFHESIRENLRFARPGASDEEIHDALRRARGARPRGARCPRRHRRWCRPVRG